MADIQDLFPPKRVRMAGWNKYLSDHKKRGRYKNFPSKLAPYNKYGIWYKLSLSITGQQRPLTLKKISLF